MDADRKRLTRSQPFTRVSVWPSGGRPACRRAGHPARRIVVWASPSLPRSEAPFRAARCRPLRQPRWLPLQPRALTIDFERCPVWVPVRVRRIAARHASLPAPTLGLMTSDSVQPGLSDTNRLEAAYRRFDAANSLDPHLEIVEGIARPRELIYAERLTDWVVKLCPDASEELRLAARCQHLCRWMIGRSSYPMTRSGYL